MSDMILLSEAECDGSPSASADQGRELEDADGEGLTGSKGCAPIGGLLGGGVDGRSRRGGQHAFHRPAITDFHLIRFTVLGHGHIASAPRISREGSRPARPADRQIAGASRDAPWLFNMGDGERPQPSALGREGCGNKGLVADRLGSWADTPVPWQTQIGLADGQRCNGCVENNDAGAACHHSGDRTFRAALATQQSGQLIAPRCDKSANPAWTISHCPAPVSTASALAPPSSVMSVTLSKVPE